MTSLFTHTFSSRTQAIPVSVHFGQTAIPATKHYEAGKVHYSLAWDRNINTARVVLSWDRPRYGSDTPVRGTRVRVRVEIGHGATTQLLGETYTEWMGKSNTFIWAADYARIKGLR